MHGARTYAQVNNHKDQNDEVSSTGSGMICSGWCNTVHKGTSWATGTSGEWRDSSGASGSCNSGSQDVGEARSSGGEQTPQSPHLKEAPWECQGPGQTDRAWCVSQGCGAAVSTGLPLEGYAQRVLKLCQLNQGAMVTTWPLWGLKLPNRRRFADSSCENMQGTPQCQLPVVPCSYTRTGQQMWASMWETCPGTETPLVSDRAPEGGE